MHTITILTLAHNARGHLPRLQAAPNRHQGLWHQTAYTERNALCNAKTQPQGLQWWLMSIWCGTDLTTYGRRAAGQQCMVSCSWRCPYYIQHKVGGICILLYVRSPLFTCPASRTSGSLKRRGSCTLATTMPASGLVKTKRVVGVVTDRTLNSFPA